MTYLHDWLKALLGITVADLNLTTTELLATLLSRSLKS